MSSYQQCLPAMGTISITACPRNEALRSAFAELADSFIGNGTLAGVTGNAANISTAKANKCHKDNAYGMVTLFNIFAEFVLYCDVVESCKSNKTTNKKICDENYLSGLVTSKLIADFKVILCLNNLQYERTSKI